MTVKQTNVVDYLGVEKGSDVIVLTIVDDLDWRDEQKHLVLLQDKINTYLRFVESGEVFESLEETLGTQVQQNPRIRVSLLLKNHPSPEATRFLRQVDSAFKNAGLELRWKVLAPVP